MLAQNCSVFETEALARKYINPFAVGVVYTSSSRVSNRTSITTGFVIIYRSALKSEQTLRRYCGDTSGGELKVMQRSAEPPRRKTEKTRLFY